MWVGASLLYLYTGWLLLPVNSKIPEFFVFHNYKT